MSTLDNIRHVDEDLCTAIVIPRPIAPTHSLPPLRKLDARSKKQIESSLKNLRLLYFSPPPSFEVKPALGAEPKRRYHDQKQEREKEVSNLPDLDTKFMKDRHHDDHDGNAAGVIPDSGYASAEEGEDEDEDEAEGGDVVPQDLDFVRIRADSCERDFAVNWLVGLIARSDDWMSTEEGELEEGMRLLQEAVELFDAFHRVGVENDDERVAEDEGKGKEEKDGELVRAFSFPLGSPSASGEARQEVQIRLNDRPPSLDDHTSVGLQGWGSSIILAEKICADPERFLNSPIIPAPVSPERSCSNWSHERKIGTSRPNHIRILELGAGTGMLGIVCAKILKDWNWEGEVVATDYHADVLKNLEGNVRMNMSGKGEVTMTISHLDWEYPSSYDTQFNEGSFDIILAADVIYHPQHATWIQCVVKRLLAKPLTCDCEGMVSAADAGLGGGGTFWLFIPVRTTGRHEGMVDTIGELFSSVQLGMGPVPPPTLTSIRLELVIVDSEEVPRKDGVGRADEVGYQLYRINWVPACG